MTESEREKKFPIHIELGKTVEIGELAVATESEPKVKKRNTTHLFTLATLKAWKAFPKKVAC